MGKTPLRKQPPRKQLQLAPRLDGGQFDCKPGVTDLFGPHPTIWTSKWYRIRSRLFRVTVTRFPDKSPTWLEIMWIATNPADRQIPGLAERRGDDWRVFSSANRLMRRLARLADSSATDPNKLHTTSGATKQ